MASLSTVISALSQPLYRVQTTHVNLHPSALLLSSLLTFCIALCDPHTSHLIACMIACAILELCFGMWRQLIAFMLAITPFYAVVGLLTALAYGNMALTVPIFVRIFLLGLTCLPMLTAREADVVRVLQTLHAPRAVTLAVLISLRFVHVMAVQAHRVVVARRTMPRRGVRLVPLWRMLVPLLDRALAIGDDLTHSLELRGFTLRSNARYSVYKTLHIRGIDYLWISLWVALNITLIVLWIMGIA